MVSERELESAIRECEDAPTSYQTCAKLATFYTIRDHLQREYAQEIEHSYDLPQVVETRADTEFMQSIQGRDQQEMWDLMDELMDAVKITNPRLYESVMRKINGQT